MIAATQSEWKFGPEAMLDQRKLDVDRALYNTREAVAYHEAGHAVVAYVRRLGLYAVSIRPDLDDTAGVSHGRTTLDARAGAALRRLEATPASTTRQRRARMRHLLMAAAGAPAQARYHADTGTPQLHWRADENADDDSVMFDLAEQLGVTSDDAHHTTRLPRVCRTAGQ